MSVQLYGVRPSATTQIVLVTLKEKGVPYEFHMLNFFNGDLKTEEYLKQQPFGQVPAIDDGDFQLYESRAIAKYIATKYAGQGTKLVPNATDLQGQAKLDQAASVEICDWFPPVFGLLVELFFNKFKGAEPDEARVKEHTETLNAKLDVYEKILGQQKYAAGDEITIVDLFHLPYGHLLTNIVGLDFLTTSARPNVARWWKDISSRPAWQEVDAEGPWDSSKV